MFDAEKEVVVPEVKPENNNSEGEQPEGEKGIDFYKQELERLQKETEAEKAARLKAEGSAQYHREQAALLRKQNNLPPGDEEPPLTRKDLVELEANITRRTFRATLASEASKIARTPSEAELILHHYDNSIIPTGDLAKDLARARLLANEKRIGKENEEIEAAENSAQNRSQAIPSGGRKSMDDSKEPEVDADLKKLLAINKMKWNPKEKAWTNERGVRVDKDGRVFDPRQK